MFDILMRDVEAEDPATPLSVNHGESQNVNESVPEVSANFSLDLPGSEVSILELEARNATGRFLCCRLVRSGLAVFIEVA